MPDQDFWILVAIFLFHIRLHHVKVQYASEPNLILGAEFVQKHFRVHGALTLNSVSKCSPWQQANCISEQVLVRIGAMQSTA